MSWSEKGVLAELRLLGESEVTEVRKLGAANAAEIMIGGISYGILGVGENDLTTIAARKIAAQLRRKSA